MQIVIVDSASKDATVSLARQWQSTHPELELTVIVQSERKGMVNALVEGLRHVKYEIFLKTDVDCMLYPDSIRTALKYLADETVAALLVLHHHIISNKNTTAATVEKTYQTSTNTLRIGESKDIWTVLYEVSLC